jgi:hypothetical protein
VTTAIVIDGRCLFDMAWHASRRADELLEGTPSERVAASAAVALLASLLGPGGKLATEPTHLLCCWDGPVAKTVKPRPQKPAQHGLDLAFFREILPELVGGAHHEPAPGAGESDDAVATAVATYRNTYDLTVITADKDLWQLLDAAQLYDLRRHATLSAADVTARWGLGQPHHVPLYLALVGDPIDGVDGVDRVGKQGAKKLLRGTEALDLVESIGWVANHLTGAQQDQLAVALGYTILRRDLPGVPAPAPLDLAPLTTLAALGLTDVARHTWARLVGRVTRGDVGGAVEVAEREV